MWGSSSGIVQVAIVIQQPDEEVRIEFPFDKERDDIDAVVADLVDTLHMTEADKPSVKAMIEAELYNTQPAGRSKFEPIATDAAAGDDSSDDCDVNDPRYRAILEKQRQEMHRLLSRHLTEKRDLAKRVEREAAIIQAPPTIPPTAAVPNHVTSSGGLCEDLIVF